MLGAVFRRGFICVWVGVIILFFTSMKRGFRRGGGVFISVDSMVYGERSSSGVFCVKREFLSGMGVVFWFFRVV